MGHIIFSLLLGVISGVITHALGYGDLWPLIVGVIVFLAYFGVFVFIFDGDGF
jgi:hypothetical protein